MCASTDTSGSANEIRAWRRSKTSSPVAPSPSRAFHGCPKTHAHDQRVCLARVCRSPPCCAQHGQPPPPPPPTHTHTQNRCVTKRACVPEGGPPAHIHDHGLHRMVLLWRPCLGLNPRPAAAQVQRSGNRGCGSFPGPGPFPQEDPTSLPPHQGPWPRDAGTRVAALQQRPAQPSSERTQSTPRRGG